jgi:hypothetical protein
LLSRRYKKPLKAGTKEEKKVGSLLTKATSLKRLSTNATSVKLLREREKKAGSLLKEGVKQKALARHVKKLNVEFKGIMPNFKVAHQKQIEYGQFGYKLWYIVKSLCKEYSVGKLSEPDEKTGVPKCRHNKRNIRPGTRVKLFHLMKRMYLDQLAMAGGEGRTLLTRVKTAALREYRERSGWEETQPDIMVLELCIVIIFLQYRGFVFSEYDAIGNPVLSVPLSQLSR